MVERFEKKSSMTKREFIKKSLMGAAGLLLLPAYLTVVRDSKLNKADLTKTGAYKANMAFGHSFDHSEFK